MDKRFISCSETETEGFAMNLAAHLLPGDILCLRGELGAGKTAFARGLLSGLGGRGGMVKSPTYTILNVYEGTPPIYHYDFFRVEDAADFVSLGLDDYWEKGISIVEWPKSFCYSLPGRKIDVIIAITGERERTIEVKGADGDQ